MSVSCRSAVWGASRDGQPPPSDLAQLAGVADGARVLDRVERVLRNQGDRDEHTGAAFARGASDGSAPPPRQRIVAERFLVAGGEQVLDVAHRRAAAPTVSAWRRGKTSQ
ncbi:hypothetical protein SPHINGO8AM_30185 [Sphingomonas sp. 8AM]|nr:hypothetical protein SPHINGO8AM_30185 [Sphingomonas sp. 8AM]